MWFVVCFGYDIFGVKQSDVWYLYRYDMYIYIR